MGRSGIDVGRLPEALKDVGEGSAFTYGTGVRPFTDGELEHMLSEAEESYDSVSAIALGLGDGSPNVVKVHGILDLEAGIILTARSAIKADGDLLSRSLIASAIMVVVNANEEILGLRGLTSESETTVLDRCRDVLSHQRSSIEGLAPAQ